MLWNLKLVLWWVSALRGVTCRLLSVSEATWRCTCCCCVHSAVVVSCLPCVTLPVCQFLSSSRVSLSPCQYIIFCHLSVQISQCVAADARRLCWCHTARSECSTARQSTGSPVVPGSTRSFRSRFCPPTGTREFSCLRGTGTRRKGRGCHNAIQACEK